MLDLLRRMFGLDEKSRLLKAARSPDATARQNALEKIGEIREPWSIGELIRLLNDLHTPIRAAARAALQRRGALAVPALIQALHSPHKDISVPAAELLGETPTSEAIEPLLTALKYSERPVQLAARRSLGKCGQLAIPVLRSTNETQPWVRQQIADALAEAERVAAPLGSPETEQVGTERA